ncbi:MAG: Uma2 family endonuclease [Alphaproteobacteria bacterium]|nr:Uma2 family endonuclease [Alphaproteobacteria bacterium]
MSNTAANLMSLDDFLLWEREQPERYEYAGGVATMMTGGSLDHSTIASNLWMALRDKLRGGPCRAFRGDTKIVADHSVRYPDLSVTCTPVRGVDDTVLEPVLVIEVVSPSTEREDRGRKKFDYFRTTSIQQYAIIEQDTRRVDLYTRSGDRWIDEIIEGAATLKLASIGAEIGLDLIYEDTELDATLLREGERRAPAS